MAAPVQLVRNRDDAIRFLGRGEPEACYHAAPADAPLNASPKLPAAQIRDLAALRWFLSSPRCVNPNIPRGHARVLDRLLADLRPTGRSRKSTVSSWLARSTRAGTPRPGHLEPQQSRRRRLGAPSTASRHWRGRPAPPVGGKH